MRRRRTVTFATAVVMALAGCTSSAEPAAAPVSPSTTTTIASAPASTTAAAPTTPKPPTPLPTTSKATPKPVVTVVPKAVPKPKPKPKPTQKPKPKPTQKPKPKPKPKPVQRDFLTGLTLRRQPVVAVKIDNTSAGRPQFGISRADVVYVEKVEGGLTRLLALFHSTLPMEVGPVRSVRSTDSQLLPQFGRPALAFSGGAGLPLDLLHATRVIDASGFGSYWRSSAAPAPYNLHVNVAQVAAASHAPAATDAGFRFAWQDPRVIKSHRVAKISVTMQSGFTEFQWDHVRRNYQVSLGGSRGYDADGTPITAQNVIVQNITDTPDGVVDSVGSPSYLSRTTGLGSFILYRGGHAIPGYWHRGSPGSPVVYNDVAGKPINLMPGRTWIMLAPPTTVVVNR